MPCFLFIFALFDFFYIWCICCSKEGDRKELVDGLSTGIFAKDLVLWFINLKKKSIFLLCVCVFVCAIWYERNRVF